MTTPKLAGKAIYLEMEQVVPTSAEPVKQLLLFPEWTDDTGRTHSPVLMERTVSKHSPRAQWNINSFITRIRPKPLADLDDRETRGYGDYINIDEYSEEEWDLLPEVSRLESKKLSLELALRREVITSRATAERDEEGFIISKPALDWQVRDNKPIVVETTTNDLEDVFLSHRTPQAVIRRINKVRDTLDNFPKKLVKSV